MRILTKLLLLCFAGAAAACVAQPLPLTQVVSMEADDGSEGPDVYAGRRAAGQAVPALSGNQVLEIRTYLTEENSFGTEVRGAEMAGAECDVKGDGGSARVKTPGAVHVPLYGYRTPQLSVQCVRNGFQDGIVSVGTFNLTHAQTMQIASQGGIVGVLLGAAVNAASDITNDEFRYVQPSILMRPGEGSGALPPRTTDLQSEPEKSAEPTS